MKKFILSLFLSLFLVLGLQLRAEALVVSYKLNGVENEAEVNPTEEKDLILVISINLERSAKLTRVYFCKEETSPENCSKEYVKYISPNTEGGTVEGGWDGYQKGETGPASPGRYWMRALLKEGENTTAAFDLRDHWIVLGEVITSSSTSTSSEESGGTSSSTPSSDSISSHSSSISLSTYVYKSPSISAGRKRLSVTRVPVDFVAEVETTESDGRYEWVFGDGSMEIGERVKHAYRYPGNYEVILRGYFSSGRESIARTNVTVVEPGISIETVNPVEGYIELVNTSSVEENIGDWMIRTSKGTFVLPRDTIIAAGKKIKIPLDYDLLQQASSTEVSLVLPDSSVVSQAALVQISTDSKKEYPSSGDLEKMKTELLVARQLLESYSRKLPQVVASIKNSVSLTHDSVEVQSVTSVSSSSREIILVPKKKSISVWSGHLPAWLSKVFKKN